MYETATASSRSSCSRGAVGERVTRFLQNVPNRVPKIADAEFAEAPAFRNRDPIKRGAPALPDFTACPLLKPATLVLTPRLLGIRLLARSRRVINDVTDVHDIHLAAQSLVGRVNRHNLSVPAESRVQIDAVYALARG